MSNLSVNNDSNTGRFILSTSDRKESGDRQVGMEADDVASPKREQLKEEDKCISLSTKRTFMVLVKM